METTRVRIEGIVKRFGATAALDGVGLEVCPGELFTLLGPSGCGKTTLLRIVGGLLEQDAGSVLFNDEAIDGVPPYRRNIGIVFQNYAIFPHLSVAGNIAYGLKARGLSPAAIAGKVAEVLRLVQLDGLADRMPAQLSGGQQQRVVLARALVIEPRLLLMDEPLSNLDAKLRVQIRSLIRTLQRTLHITTIYVTHDQEEALAISDTIAVMERGRVLQVGKPWELYLRPANRFVADFIGTMNVVHAKGQIPEVEGRWSQVTTEFGETWKIGETVVPGRAVMLGVRPESLQLEPGANATDAWNTVQGTVKEVAYLGPTVRYSVTVADGVEMVAEIHNPDFSAIRRIGEPITLWFAGRQAILLSDLDQGDK